jgi:hypothetical protein
MKTTEPPIEKFTVNGLEFTGFDRNNVLRLSARTGTGDVFWLVRHYGTSWVWRCHDSEWKAINVAAGNLGDYPLVAVAALTDAARYFRTLADSFGVTRDAAKAAIAKAEGRDGTDHLPS